MSDTDTDIDIILEAPRKLGVKHSKALIAWARQERDYTELEAIDNALDGYIDDPVKTPTLKAIILIRSFGILLKHALGQAGYNVNEPDQLQALAGQIHTWQENDRNIPYDALLVQTWAEGKGLPTKEAWEGIKNHFNSATSGIPSSMVQIMDGLHEAISNLRILARPDYDFRCETQATALARFKKAKESGLSEERIAEALKKAGYKGKKGRPISTIMVSALLYGNTLLNPKVAEMLDAQYTKYRLECRPPLINIYWQEKYQEAQALWDDAKKPFGSKLKALRTFSGMTNEALAECIGMGAPQISLNENEAIILDKIYPICPDVEMLAMLLEVFAEKEAAFAQRYSDAYRPFLTEERQAEIAKARDRLQGDRREVTIMGTAPDDLLAAVALLREQQSDLSFKAISGALDIKKAPGGTTGGAAARANFRAREQWGDDLSKMPDAVRTAAKERLTMVGAAADGKVSTAIGAIIQGIGPAQATDTHSLAEGR